MLEDLRRPSILNKYQMILVELDRKLTQKIVKPTLTIVLVSSWYLGGSFPLGHHDFLVENPISLLQIRLFKGSIRSLSGHHFLSSVPSLEDLFITRRTLINHHLPFLHICNLILPTQLHKFVWNQNETKFHNPLFALYGRQRWMKSVSQSAWQLQSAYALQRLSYRRASQARIG